MGDNSWRSGWGRAVVDVHERGSSQAWPRASSPPPSRVRWRLVRAGRSLRDLVGNRWLRAVLRLVGLVLLSLTTIVTTGVWYLSNSVPLPDDPVAPQASQLLSLIHI